MKYASPGSSDVTEYLQLDSLPFHVDDAGLWQLDLKGVDVRSLLSKYSKKDRTDDGHTNTWGYNAESVYIWDSTRLSIRLHTIKGKIMKLNQNTQIEGFRIFPNPCQDQFRISLDYLLPREFMITDASGRIIKRLLLHNASEMVDVKGLPPGLYSIQSLGPDKQNYGKFVVR